MKNIYAKQKDEELESIHSKIFIMPRTTVILLAIAILAGILGFFVMAANAAFISKILFFIFMVFFFISLAFGGKKAE